MKSQINSQQSQLIGKGRLSGSEINSLANAMNLKVKIYQFDELPKHLSTGNYIILLGQGNGHWTALHCNKFTAAYFDSFSVPPPEEVVRACGQRIIFTNDDEEQRLNSNHCGQYCLQFLAKMMNII